jgi:hypothetical protein
MLPRRDRTLALIVVLGILLGATTLGAGFYADDYTFLADLEIPAPKSVSIFSLYDFSHGRADTSVLVPRGPFPWWTDPNLKLRFFRPLSSALFGLDHALFGHSPFGYRVHALIWFALFFAGAVALFRLVFAPPLLYVSALLFVLNSAHSEPLAWLASRNLLISGTPALWGLVAHVTYRERGFRAGRWLAPLGLTVGLLGGEAALGVAVFWVAYELWGRSTRPESRATWRDVWSPHAITFGYHLAYKLGDYGAAHSAAYFEPLSDPMGFLAAAVQRIPLMLGESLFGVPSTLATVFPPAPFVAIGLVATVLVAVLLRSVWNAVPETERRAVRWLALGALASLGISVGGFPGPRLLLVPSLGTTAVLATILCHGWRKLDLGFAAVVTRRSAWILLFLVHVVAAPIWFVVSSTMLSKLGQQIDQIDASLDGVLPAPGSAPAKAPNVFVIASDPLANLYVGAAHAVRLPGSFSGFNALSMTHATHDVQRIDDRTLLIETDRPMLRGAFEGVFSDPREAPWKVGSRVALEEATVTVRAVDDGFPTSIEVKFAAPLEDDRFCLLAWQSGKLLPLRVPIGDHVVIPWTPGPTGFF